MNEIKRTEPGIRWVSYSSLVLGILGGAFFWWVPMGIVLSMAGLLFGFVDWTVAYRRSLDSRLAVAGVCVSVLTLAFGCIIAALGWQLITFGGW
jgi:hypothetical protein